MHSLSDTALESNPYIKINFEGGDLSSDAGLLLIKEFAENVILPIIGIRNYRNCKEKKKLEELYDKIKAA